MNYGDITAQMSGLLNRRDATSAQIAAWLQLGLTKIQRELRCPAMEKTLIVTIASGYGGLVIPPDMLELIRLVNSDGVKIVKEDITTVNQLALTTGKPINYCREGGVWLLGNTPGIGDTIKIVYYAEFADLLLPADTNVLTVIAPDLIVYGGLEYAGDFYSDRRSTKWEQRRSEILADLQQQADDDELSGGSVMSPAYQFCDEPIT